MGEWPEPRRRAAMSSTTASRELRSTSGALSCRSCRGAESKQRDFDTVVAARREPIGARSTGAPVVLVDDMVTRGAMAEAAGGRVDYQNLSPPRAA